MTSDWLPPTLSGRPRSQNSWELREFISTLQRSGCRSYLEIGARHGDTLWTVFRKTGVSPCCAIDLPGARWGSDSSGGALLFARDQIREHGGKSNVILDDSTNPFVIDMASVGFDAIFIDGDHRLDGVTADFHNYLPFAKRLIAFHDIAAGPQQEGIEVPVLWAQIKQRFPGKTAEIIAPGGSPMGIGVLFTS